MSRIVPVVAVHLAESGHPVCVQAPGLLSRAIAASPGEPGGSWIHRTQGRPPILVSETLEELTVLVYLAYRPKTA